MRVPAAGSSRTPDKSTALGSETQGFLHATQDCPNLSQLLPSFGQAPVTCLPRHAAMAASQCDIAMSQVVPMDVAPTVPQDRLTVGEALAKLAHQTVSDAPHTQPHGPASDKSPDAPISQSSQPLAATLGAPDLSAQIPREQRSLGKRGILARVAITVCLGAAAIWAWQSYGSAAKDMIATGALPFGWILARPAPTPDAAQAQAAAPPAVAASAPPPAQGASQAASQAASMTQPATTAAPVAVSSDEQVKTMARDLAALRQTVEQLAAGQEKLTREMATLQAVKPQAVKPQADKPVAEKPDKRKPHHVAAPGTGSDAFDPTQNPNAPGVPRPLGSIVLRRASP